MDLIYWNIFILICFATLFFNFSRIFRVSVFYYCLAAPLILLAGLRSEYVGRDYTVYREYFNLAPNSIGYDFFAGWLNSLPNVDIAYVYLNSIIKFFGFQFEALIFLTALFSISLYATFYYKSTKLPFIALAVYYTHTFFYREMIQLRAGMACALLLWCFRQVGLGRYKVAAILYLGAISLHLASAIAIVPVLFFFIIKRYSAMHVVLSILFASAISMVVDPNLGIFSTIDRLAVYQDTEYAVALGILSNPVTIKQIILLLLVVAIFPNGKDIIDRPVFRMCFISYWFSTLWLIGFNKFEIIGARGASFTSIAEPLIVAESVAILLKKLPDSGMRFIVVFGTLLLCLAMLYLNLEVKGIVNKYVSIF